MSRISFLPSRWLNGHLVESLEREISLSLSLSLHEPYGTHDGTALQALCFHFKLQSIAKEDQY